MKKFEYKVERMSPKVEDFNKLGEDGWELFEVDHAGPVSLCYFKREKK